MSLRDTLEAARKEVEDGGGIPFGKSKDTKEAAEEETSSGFSRRSTAKAKPTRERASSVRVVSADDAKAGRSGKKPSEMTKEERKAERERQRDIEDLRNMAANALLKQDPVYKQQQRIWWIVLGIGLGFTIVSFGINWLMNNNEAYASGAMAMLALASLVLAYVCIIGAFIYDMVKSRPIRREYDEKVKGMSKKKLEQVLRDDEAAKAAKKAAKANK